MRLAPRCPYRAPGGARRARLPEPAAPFRRLGQRLSALRERARHWGATSSRRWDAEYERGRYAGEPPVKFTETILEAVAGSAGLSGGRGLYVGCGNGRNFARLVCRGLNLTGIDPSPAAIGQLAARCPSAAGRLKCTDMESFEPGARFDYLVAIQVFQHGDAASAARHFERAARLLRPGGALFLRVNSASTDVYFGHRVKETTAGGSSTVRYLEGPKRGTDVHFFSGRDLAGHLLRAGFELEAGPDEDRLARRPPKTGTWSQWEAVASKA